jgi:hypothetical protein
VTGTTVVFGKRDVGFTCAMMINMAMEMARNAMNNTYTMPCAMCTPLRTHSYETPAALSTVGREKRLAVPRNGVAWEESVGPQREGFADRYGR